MKKLIFILFSLNLILTTCFAQSGWIKQSPYPQSGDLISSKFFDTNTGYAVTVGRNFIRTTNGGVNWTVHTFGNNQVFALDFIDMNTGFIVGASGNCYKTTNGGINWSDESFSINKNLYAVSFINDTGYILGSGQTIYKSTDRGNSWISKNIDTAIGFVDACFINASTGHAIARDFQGNSRELITTNGGENWYFQQLAVNDVVKSIYFVDKNTGYIGGGFIYSSIQKTTNGGMNWYVQYPPGHSLEDIMFADNLTGYAVGAGGTLIKTNDGGANWESFSMNDVPYLITIFVINAENCYAMGSYGNIFKTTNGGTNWHNLFSGTVNDLNKAFFVNENTGYAVGYGSGTYGKGVVKTTNGGQYWYKQTIPTTAPLTSVFFINPDSGYAVGVNGAIIKTTNGGVNWQDLYQQTFGSIHDVKFINFDTGYIISGWNIYKTTNGGLNWVENHNAGGYCLYFVNAETGYAASSNRILKTTNAGESWSQQVTPATEAIRSIFFLDSTTGYAVGGEHGVIIKTTNGGVNWIAVYESSNYLPFLSIYFTNINTGYVVADYSNNVLKTTNGGINWFVQNTGQTGFTNGFFDLKFLNDSVGYMVGKFGIILKTTTGGELIGITPINTKIPNKIHLYQNYPNPFNPITKFNIELPFSVYVKLTIYDILGREIAELVNEKLSAGKYNVKWDGSNYPSGVYFYRLEADDFSQTRKMVLLK